MRLSTNWKEVVRHAWSIRLLIVAGILSGLEALVALLNGADYLPAWLRAIMLAATPLVIGAAFVARLVAQSTIQNRPRNISGYQGTEE